MPSRFNVLAITAFWLATMGWLSYRDLRLSLLPGEPAPCTIDLADEAEMSTIRWTVFKDDKPKPTGYARTHVKYHEPNDTFEVSAEVKLWAGGVQQGNADHVLESKYFVTRDGQLRGIDAKFTMFTKDNPPESPQLVAQIGGDVKDRRFTPHYRVEVGGRHTEGELAPIAVSGRGSVLNPLQPVNRLTGLKKGQHWQMPFVSPLDDLIPAFLRTTAIRFLDAKVRSQTELLQWGQSQVSCLVIDYSGEDLRASTWVRESDGTVLRQEATQHGEKLVLQRDY
jgi:hypothetical protein